MDDELDELNELNDAVAAERIANLRPRRSSTPREAAIATQGETDLKNGELKMWAVHSGRNFVPCEQAVTILPPGQYRIEQSNHHGVYWSKIDINLDEIIKLPDSVSDEVIQHIQNFWNKEELFRQFKSLWKRGVLLWGPQGSGKTSTLQMISKNIVDLGGISVYVDNPELCATGLKLLRQVEPKRPLVIMVEDIDAVIDEYGESDLLAIMDGELQIDNVCCVATTNYPEKLDKRFINRPSRFDIVRKIGMPNADARSIFLKSKNPRLAEKKNVDELRNWILATDKFSIAHMKELIISVEIFDMKFEDAVKKLKTMANLPKSSDDSGRSVGFTGEAT